MRITGGMYRSRTLVAPRGQTTRPTSDRVREAIFSMLQSVHPLGGAAVLDLYAGTGALGLEALSRGAERIVAVERGRDALAALRTNIDALGAQAKVRIVAAPVARALETFVGEPTFTADVVFVDPPYADVPSGALAATLAPLVQAARLGPEAIVVVEHAGRDAPPSLLGLTIERTRRYGDTAVTFYRRAEHEASDEQVESEGQA